MELNKIHLDSAFANTVVPSGQRFLFLGYYDGLETEEVVIRYKDSDGNYGNIASGSAGKNEIIEYFYPTANKTVEFENTKFPCGIRTSTGKIFPLLSETLTESEGKFVVDLSTYLTLANEEFDANTQYGIYFSAGGIKGNDGIGLSLRGAYSDTVVYSCEDGISDAVQYEGSLWGYINETPSSGNLPPSLPTVSNEYWTLLVKKGEQGEKGEAPSEQYKEVSALENGKIVVSTTAVPVFIRTSNNNFYPIEKDTLIQIEDTFYIEVEPYLAYDNVTEFSGTWRIYLAGGIKGDSMRYDEAGVIADRSQYDDRPYKFCFLATDEEKFYVKLSDSSGDWSNGISIKGDRGEQGIQGVQGEKGEKGEQGIQGVQGEKGEQGIQGVQGEKGEKGEGTQITIGDNGNWFLDGVDTGEPARGKGANVILSPTPPAEPFEGMILVSVADASTEYFDLESLPVVIGTTPPATAENGTIFIVEAE